MNPEDRRVIYDLVFVPGRGRRGSPEDVLRHFGAVDGHALGLSLLADAVVRKDGDDVEAALIVCFVFGMTLDHLELLVLAGLVGRSESWLSQVERGKRGVDSHAVLTRMAAVLRVEVEELTGPDHVDGEEGQRVYAPAAEIERAMMCYDAIGGPEPTERAEGHAALTWVAACAPNAAARKRD